MTEANPPLDDILASIRKAVEHGQSLADPEPDAAEAATPPLPALAAVTAPLTPALTVEELLRSLLEPQLKLWLDANLPELVERLTRAEIARLTGH